MEVTINELAYLLSIPAGALSRDESTMYFVTVEDETLIEKHWNGNEISEQVFIAEDVKESASAKYFLNDNVRRVFFTSSENTLQCYEYDESEEEWVQVELQGEGDSLAIHAETKISGCFNGDDQLVFFQSPSGALQGLRVFASSGECSLLPPFESIPEKVPLIHSAYEASDDAVHVLHLDDSNAVHDLKLEDAGWQDTSVEGDGFGDHEILSFLKTEPNSDTFSYLAISTSNLVVYIDQGKRIELGTLDRQRFVPATSEECAPEIFTLTKKAVKTISGSKK